MNPQRTPLDAWLAAKLGLPAGVDLDQASLAAYRLDRLKRTVAHARLNSPFYRDRLAGLPEDFPHGLEDFSALPFITAADLRAHHLAMLCVSQDRVARVVTLTTSGTTAAPKRLYFSDADLERTLDFFHHGMSTMVGPGGKVLILLPGSRPDSVGDLLARSLARMDVMGVVHGPVLDVGEAVARTAELGADCLVGIPVQVLAMAEHPDGNLLAGKVKSVLLTTDYVPQALARRVERAWGCEVFEHYGMTETGLGGGVDCRAHQGYHLRAADLYCEVIDPDRGRILPPDRKGELVVSTLTREAMPLLRYRTGDWGRLLDGPCSCGGFTPRLARVPGRLSNSLDMGCGAILPMWELDEALFAVPGLLDYRVGRAAKSSRSILTLTVQTIPGQQERLYQKVQEALQQLSSSAGPVNRGGLALGKVEITSLAWPVDGSTKRTDLAHLATDTPLSDDIDNQR